jgi:hypothetical protein
MRKESQQRFFGPRSMERDNIKILRMFLSVYFGRRYGVSAATRRTEREEGVTSAAGAALP